MRAGHEERREKARAHRASPLCAPARQRGREGAHCPPHSASPATRPWRILPARSCLALIHASRARVATGERPSPPALHPAGRDDHGESLRWWPEAGRDVGLLERPADRQQGRLQPPGSTIWTPIGRPLWSPAGSTSPGKPRGSTRRLPVVGPTRPVRTRPRPVSCPPQPLRWSRPA